MTREEFIGKLQMCYFGERNAFNEIVSEYDRLNNIINELNEDIPCLLEIINRNEKDIKIYQDEWIAVRSTEERLKALKESNK